MWLNSVFYILGKIHLMIMLHLLLFSSNRVSPSCYFTTYTTMQLCLKHCGSRNLCNCYVTLENQLCTLIAILMTVLAIHMRFLSKYVWFILYDKIAHSIEIIIFVGLFNFIILFLINVSSGTSGHFFNWSTCYLFGIRLIE